MSDRVRQFNLQTRFAIDEDAWPPNQQQNFIPVLLIHHEDRNTFKQSAMQSAVQHLAGPIQSGRLYKHYPQDNNHLLSKALDSSKTTKQLDDILAPLQDSEDAQFILVEGLPGIGKSSLLQEIAYNWAKGNILQKFKLVLLIQLRSPAVQQASFVTDLFQLFCIGDTDAAEIITTSSKYFFRNGGQDIVFLFDGLDEFPEHLQKDSLITSIMKRKVLPHCGLIVSSRPHASVRLRQQATIRVDILGFSEQERELYIEQSLKGQPCAVKELTEYLKNNLTINGLCFIPFNMVILIYLYEQGISLPSNSTQLYNHFVCLTICRYLVKSGYPLDNTITDVSKLPEPYNTIIKQLSKLALEGINNNKLIFTLQEMRATCPDVIPGAVNGLGLLQAVQHFGLAGKTMTFNFVHLSIQEFLAACHITQLSPDKELQVLEENFWSNLHCNMFTMYISLTKGQQSAFKQFLSCRDDTIIISEIFLKDQLKCLRLFHSFHEASDELMYTAIQRAQIFNDKVVKLNNINLSSYEIECITLFLTCSPHKKWNTLNLQWCYIQDHGFHVLYRNLTYSNVTIRELNLSFAGLSRLSSSSLSDLVINCKIETLLVQGNQTIGEEPTLYNMLSHPSSSLMKLDILGTNLSTSSAITLFTALVKGNKLQWLIISFNPISDEACNVIAASLKSNTSLEGLSMISSKITAEAAQHLIQALQCNDTLQELELSHYTEDAEEKIRSLQEEVNKIRENRDCQIKLNINFCLHL